MGSKIRIYGSQMGFSKDGKAKAGDYKVFEYNEKNTISIKLEKRLKDNKER